MSKLLPYFQFEPAEYLTKDISFCSLAAQGLFINICSYYWQRNCVLTKEQLLKRLNFPTELNELIKEGVIDSENGKIFIKFLDKQLKSAVKLSRKNSKNGALGGRPKGKPNTNPKETQKKPSSNPTQSQSKGIKEDKIKEDKIKEKKKENKENDGIPFSEIITFLNDQTNRKRPQEKFKEVGSIKTKITARWNEGYRLEDFKSVIIFKIKEWSKIPKMKTQLVPEVLFGTKFSTYRSNSGDYIPPKSKKIGDDGIPDRDRTAVF